MSLRYQDTGEVHLDFHRTINGTIAYLCRTHGKEMLREVLYTTAHTVYRSLWEDLKRGDTSQWVAHWRQVLEREGGVYRIEETEDGVRLTITRCPAIAYLVERGIAVDPSFCSQTQIMNEAWSEDSPLMIETHCGGEGQCVQTIRLKTPQETSHDSE